MVKILIQIKIIILKILVENLLNYHLQTVFRLVEINIIGVFRKIQILNVQMNLIGAKKNAK